MAVAHAVDFYFSQRVYCINHAQGSLFYYYHHRLMQNKTTINDKYFAYAYTVVANTDNRST